MGDVILDLGFDINILPNKTWENMGKPKLVWSPIQLMLEMQYKIYPIVQIKQVKVNLDRFNSKMDFEEIEIVDKTNPYMALLGIN